MLAARAPLPLQDRLVFMLIADRVNAAGVVEVTDEENEKMLEEIAAECRAIGARLLGDHTLVFGINNDRVDRIYEAIRIALAEESA
jgi:hypothetical protein